MASADRGYLIPIGGAVRKRRHPVILRRFVELCGGREGRIAVVPTASREPNLGANYADAFADLGAGDARVLDFKQRSDTERDEWLDYLGGADGVFFTGGKQLRLSRLLGGTPVSRLLRQRFDDGLHIAGSSAGASFMSEHMIAFGDEGATPRTHMVALTPGLGLSTELIIDQHFRQRDRLGRLLMAINYNPSSVGLGLDENTAAFVAPDDTLEVVGSGSATIIDASGLEYSSMGREKGDPVSMVGVTLHILLHGARFDLATRRVTPPPPTEDYEPVNE
ncbi:MAG: cyanophycinase [Acidobacteriota bacterium]